MLTLTATPIPRTLQMALSGIREMSIIATPPIDRLTVRTYITPSDPVVLREALLREKYRGGQAYFVAPRIKDLPELERFLREQVPEVKYRRRPRPDGADPAGRRHERLLRRPVRRAAVDHHRRVRPRHPHRQHPDHPPRRHVRPGPALSAARPGRPGQGARLRLSDHARPSAADPLRRTPAEGDAVAGQPGRRLPAGQPRPRHPRRRQPPGRRAVRPHPRDRRRALPADAGGRGQRAASERGEPAGEVRPRLVAADQHRRGGADPRSTMCRT